MPIRQRFTSAPETLQTISAEYIDGISEGRAVFNKEGMQYAKEHLDNLTATARTFAANSPVGQLLRGERDFWKHKVKHHAEVH